MSGGNLSDNAERQSEEIDAKKYLEGRVKERIDYYCKDARKKKRLFLSMRSLTVVLGAIVPVLINISSPFLTAIATIFSTIVVILVAIESVFHFRERWKNYRAAELMLRREEYYFLTRSGPYEKYFETRSGPDGKIKEKIEGEAFHRLVRQIESTIASESTATLHTLTSLDQKANE